MNFNDILIELQSYKRPKDELSLFYIKERLNKSLFAYYSDVKNSLRFYRQQDELRLLRGLNRE